MAESSHRLSVVPPPPLRARETVPGEPEWWFNLMTGWAPGDLVDTEVQFVERLVDRVQADLNLELGTEADVEPGRVMAAANRAVNSVLSALVEPDGHAFTVTWYHLVARWDALAAVPVVGAIDQLALIGRAEDDYYARARKSRRRGIPEPSPSSGVERADGQWFVNLCDGGFRTLALYRIGNDGEQHTVTWVPEDEWPERFQEVE